MKKFFLIPLMACFSCVMAFAATVPVGTYAELKNAVDNATAGDVIELTKDISFGNVAKTNQINITKSITIDGKGFTLTGSSQRQSGAAQYATIWINDGASNDLNVTVKNITLVNKATSGNYAFCIQPRGGQNTITLENVIMDLTAGGRGNSAPLQFGGNETRISTLNVTNCKFLGKNSDYPILTWVPVNIVAQDSYFNGYCGLYFKDGSAGSVVNADACDFDAPNVHDFAGGWNNFGVFATEDANITINLHNCGMNAQETGFKANQGMILPQQGGCVVNISGDNSHINGRMVLEHASYPGYFLAFFELTGGLTITGGTYSVDPSHYGPYNPYTWFGDQDPTLPDEDLYANFVPDGYEVKEITMEGVATPLYRVVKKAEEKEPGVMYDLNDYVPVEGEGYGDNPVSSFDLSTGTNMTLNQETTTAGYVQVSDKDNGVNPPTPTTVTVGTPSQDQTLVINNGLDVQGDSKVVVEAGSTLQIGEGGINTEKPENIIIEADENGAASLLLDPTITINQTPNLTVRMTAKQIGKLGGDYYWHRFAMPVDAGITSWEKEGTLAPSVANNYPTYLYGWDYENNEWLKLTQGVADMVPLQGYTLTLASEEMPGVTGLQDVTYIFQGNLVGNTDKALNFQAEGFNFFGNSYTGYMDVLTLIQEIKSNNVEGTVYMWCNDPTDDEGRYQSYEGVSLLSLQDPTLRLFLADWQKEVAPMQTFILRLRGADSADESVNYASTIWGNPRYGNNSGSNPAPRRVASANSIDSHMAIIVKADNSKGSRVEFTQDVDHSDAFESGYDVVKYMNENAINLYATVDGEDLSTVVTDAIEGKTLSLKTSNEIAYTMSFKNIIGNEYALRDNVTGQVIAIEEGATYEFAAQPNSTVEGRFEIVSRAQMPTAIENTEVNANVKGIYTIMGQYMGEDFSILPAGVYVVNGVKIVK